jgi:hypothetical protein
MFGIFNDEGCIEDGFVSHEAAETRRANAYANDDAHVAEICHEHPEQEKDSCEECNSDEDGESSHGE